MPDDGAINTVIEKLGRAFEEFKAANEVQIKEIKKGVADAVTADKIQKINDEIDRLQGLVTDAGKKSADRVDELEARLNRPGNDGGVIEDETKLHERFNVERKAAMDAKGRSGLKPVALDEFKSYREQFKSWLKYGAAFLDYDQRAMSVGSDPDGGFLVTPTMSARIVERQFETSLVRPLVTVETISGNELEGLSDKDEAGSGGWVSETGTRAKTATPQLGTWKIPVHELFAYPEVTQKLLDDANRDVEGWLGAKVGDKLGRVQNASFINGDGVGKPRGFASYATAATADSSRAWGVLEHVATGVNGDFAGSNPADHLFDLEAAFKPAYLAGATWATRRTVIQKIRKFKGTDNNYLWQPSLQAGVPASLIGYPIALLEDMPALATGSLSLALGNFKLGYTIVDRVGITVIRDNLTNKPYIGFYVVVRVGGDVLQFECIKFLKFGS